MAMNWVPGDSGPARPAVLAVVVASLAVSCTVLPWLDSRTRTAPPGPAARTVISTVAGGTGAPAAGDGRISLVTP